MNTQPTPAQLFPTRRFWKAIIGALLLTFALCMITFAAFGTHYHYIPPPTTAPAVVVVPDVVRPAPKFIIGVCQQPADSFAKWKELGVNTVVDIPGWQGGDIAAQDKAWVDAANRAGLYQIRKIVGAPVDDAKNPLLLAWAHQDEPEDHGLTPAQLKAAKDATAALKVPWFLNLDGSFVMAFKPGGPDKATYLNYLAAGDWIGSDLYPVSGWNLNIDLFSVGQCVDRLADWSGGKPQLVYVEASRQALPWLQNPSGGREPTIAEFQLIIHQAVWRKAKGIIYFPLQPMSGFSWDNSSAAIKAEMIKQNAALSQ